MARKEFTVWIGIMQACRKRNGPEAELCDRRSNTHATETITRWLTSPAMAGNLHTLSSWASNWTRPPWTDAKSWYILINNRINEIYTSPVSLNLYNGNYCIIGDDRARTSAMARTWSSTRNKKTDWWLSTNAKSRATNFTWYNETFIFNYKSNVRSN